MNCRTTIAITLVTFLFALEANGDDLPPPPSPSDGAVKLMRVKTIPRLKLENADFEEAFAEIVQHWDGGSHGVAFPFEVKDFWDRGSHPRVSLDLRDIPYQDALVFLVDICHRQFDFASGDGIWPGDKLHVYDPDPTDIFEMTEQAMDLFDLDVEMSSDQLLDALARFNFHPSAALLGGSDPVILVMTASREEISSLHGILMLLAEGYTISKPGE